MNDGIYSGHTRIISAGLEVRFDVLLGKRRIPRYGADYEEVAAAPTPPPPRPKDPDE